MLDNKNKTIVSPMVWFPIRYEKDEDLIKLINLFHKHNLKVSNLIDLKAEQTCLAISFGVWDSDSKYHDDIFISPTHISNASLWANKNHIQIYAHELVNNFNRIFIIKDQEFFNNHIVHYYESWMEHMTRLIKESKIRKNER